MPAARPVRASWASPRRRDTRRRADRGSATAEIAVAFPGLVLVLAASLWGVAVAAAQVACVDAARAGARAAARGEPLSAVRAAARDAAPRTAKVSVRRDPALTGVDVAAAVRAPLFTGLPPLVVRGRSVAATEPAGPPR